MCACAGGSGSSREDIRYAIEAGTVKMNIDTDTQCAPLPSPTAPPPPCTGTLARAVAPLITPHAPSRSAPGPAAPLRPPHATTTLATLTLTLTPLAPPTRWAFWDGLRSYEAEFRPYLQGQIGNPDGDEKPNKKYYDPRMALRRGEEFMAKRLIEAAEDLNCINVI